MFVYDLTAYFREDAENYDFTFHRYLTALSGNNQVIFETIIVCGGEDFRVARVTTPYMDSLDEKYDDIWVTQMKERLSEYLREPVAVTYIGEDYTYRDDCATGKAAENYVLCIHPDMADLSPICCGHCRYNIPFYLLPPLSEQTREKLNSWHTVYTAYDKLFYATGIGEISAHKMMCNISSPLNQSGLEVCRMLEKELGKPVYYYLYRFYGKQYRKCPICHAEWKHPEGNLYDYQCDNCRLVADKADMDH